MQDTMLAITFLCDGRVRTLPFNPLVQSVLWIGCGNSTTSADAMLCIERNTSGITVSVLRDGWGLLLPGSSSRESSITLSHATPTMVGVMREGGAGPSSLYIRPVVDGMCQFDRRTLPKDASFEVGRMSGCAIRYDDGYVSGRHARLICRNHILSIEDLKSGNGTFVNELALVPFMPYELEVGDEVRIQDWTFVVGKGFICTNRPPGLSLCLCNANSEERATLPYVHASKELGKGDCEFYPAPRIARSTHTLSLTVDGPPSYAEHKEQSALMRMGPSLLMGLSASFMLVGSVQRASAGESLMQVAPTIAMVATLAVGTVLWPLVSGRYERREARRANARRSQRYVAYLDAMEQKLIEGAREQTQVLRENRIPIGEVLALARDRSGLLMSRTCDHEDYLSVRVGIGSVPLEAKLTWPNRSFSLVDDDMWHRLEHLRSHIPQLAGVPLTLNLVRHPVVGVYGARELAWEFVRGVVVQVCAFHSYQEVKVVLVVDASEQDEWGPLATLQHLCNDGGTQRYVAASPDGMTRLDRLFEGMPCLRDSSGTGDARHFVGHCVIVCSNLRLFWRSTFLTTLLAQGAERVGASLVFVGTSTAALPRACTYLVDLSHEGSVLEPGLSRQGRMFARDDVSDTLAAFSPDIMVSRAQSQQFALDMGRLQLPGSALRERSWRSTGYLELLGVGNVQHLNVGERWRDHDASRSLRAELGVDELGSVITLDLHEDGQGPHGLIAGTTGSGKSEFITTLILSLCVNYAPSEVSILIIDYKGGGLAGAFDTMSNRLPHLCGTITNLDGSVIRRSLVSLRSELERRQRMLNNARTLVGETTMDVRKYQSLFRQGRVQEPMPHLVVVADEFAELKQQEPEFMEELITSARIGRSLGVHLVLATQKPAGVVNEQIWSNARFKACLKVSDAADSKEMIRRDDAARLNRPGRFCLLVGYDEAFLEGQAAYAGEPYVARTRLEPRRNTTVQLLGCEGEVLMHRDAAKPRLSNARTELQAVLEELAHTARRLHEQASPLWLPPLPKRLTLEEPGWWSGFGNARDMTCTLALADDPWNQRQEPITTSLLDAGNLALYGPQNAGVEEMLKAAVASLAQDHSPEELWLYGIDSGATFSSLEALPHWGGTIKPGDTDGFAHLLHMLDKFISSRRQMVHKAWPQVVVALDGLSTWLDVRAGLEDDLERLAREGPRYGVHMLVVAYAPHDVRMRLRTSFGFELAVSLRDEGEYAMLLGSLGGAPIPQGRLRGLFRKDGRVLEFVGAQLAKSKEHELRVIRNICAHVNAGPHNDVPPIPRVPGTVTPCDLAGCLNAGTFPVGFDKVEAAPFSMELRGGLPLLVTGTDRRQLASYLVGACQTLADAGVPSCLIDPWGDLPRVARVHTIGVEEVRKNLRAHQCLCLSEEVIVMSDVMQLIERLLPDEAAMLKDALAQVHERGLSPMVLGAESWRLGSVFEDWMRHVLASCTGLWVGDGFATQTVFPLPRIAREHRTRAQGLDGFAVLRGNAHAVRYVQPVESEETCETNRRGEC